MQQRENGLLGGSAARLPGVTLRDAAPLRVECRVDEATGRIRRKIETAGERHDVYDYLYDEDGRLFRVFRNDLLQEQYLYTPSGQRQVRSNGWADQTVKYFYGADGLLYLTASATLGPRFEYDEAGRLAAREQGPRKTTYQYEETRLRGVTLPDGTTIRYAYDPNSPNPVGPAAKFRRIAGTERRAMEFRWRDLATLASCVDHDTGLRYDFAYEDGRLARVLLRGPAVSRLLRTAGGEAELLVGCDQAGTPKLFTDARGREVKYLDYDSFGILLDDTYPELFIPVGFAGGLPDKDTGFVRFGYRDYDPSVGRFTCPDPLGDTGGDHDLYDYCVDDPVSSIDPLGLRMETASTKVTVPESPLPSDEGKTDEKKDDQRKGDEDGKNSEPKSALQKFGEIMLPYIFMDRNSPEFQRMNQGNLLMLEEKTRGMARGLHDILRIQQAAPFPGPGASQKDWDNAERAWQRGEEDFQNRKRAYLERK